MAVLTQDQLETLVLDAVNANTATDAPLSSAAGGDIERFLNNNYQLIWELEGGGLTKVASATAWTSAQLATGVVTGILTDIAEIIAVFASTTSGSTGFSSGDKTLQRVEYNYIQHLRNADGGYGTYATPKCYAVSRLSTSTPASVGLHQLDYWPSVTGFYLPTHYRKQFVPLDGSSVTTPDVTDIGSRDIGWLAAADLAQLLGRSELVPGILMKVSDGTAKALERKLNALLSGDQNVN